MDEEIELCHDVTCDWPAKWFVYGDEHRGLNNGTGFTLNACDKHLADAKAYFMRPFADRIKFEKQ